MKTGQKTYFECLPLPEGLSIFHNFNHLKISCPNTRILRVFFRQKIIKEISRTVGFNDLVARLIKTVKEGGCHESQYIQFSRV